MTLIELIPILPTGERVKIVSCGVVFEGYVSDIPIRFAKYQVKSIDAIGYLEIMIVVDVRKGGE